MSCSYSCSKMFLFVVNLVVALCSLALLVVCGLALANMATIYEVKTQDGTNLDLEVPLPLALYSMIGVASFAFILSFLGCCGAIKESSCLLYSFATLLSIILAVQLAIIAFAYYKEDDFKSEINKALNSTLYEYPKSKDGIVKRSWDVLQTDLHCCGINGPEDWRHVFGNDTLPNSCCPVLAAGATCNAKTADPVPSESGCLTSILSKLGPVFITVLVVAIIELFSVIIACCLASSISDQYRTV